MPVFVANMSGNLIRLGMALGNVQWPAIGMAAIALGAFAFAAFVGAAVLDGHVVNGVPLDPSPLLLVEVALLGAVAVIACVTNVEFSAELTWPHITIVLLAAGGMGAQSVAIRRVGQTAVSTTYGTGSIVRLSEKLALGMRGAPSMHAVPRRRSVQVLTSILLAYVVGAAIASALPASRGLLAIVPVITLALARTVHRLERRPVPLEPASP